MTPKRRGVILDSSKKFTSINDSEALMTADNSTMGLNHDKAGHLTFGSASLLFHQFFLYLLRHIFNGDILAAL